MNKKPLITVILLLTMVFSVSAEENTFSVDVPAVSAAQNEDIVFTVTVTNDGSGDLIGIEYTVSDLASADETITPGSDSGNLDVLYGESTSFDVVFSPDAQQKAGLYTGVIDLSFGDLVVSADLTAEIEANAQLEGSATPAEAIIDRNASAMVLSTDSELSITNTGNTDITEITLSISDLEGPETLPGSVLTISEDNFELAVGEDIVVLLSPVVDSAASGTYSGMITIEGGDENLVLPVVLNVLDAVRSIVLDDVVFDVSERDTIVSKDILLTNDGHIELTGITLTTDADVNISGTVLDSLLPGESFTVTLETFADKELDSGIIVIGDLVFDSDQITETAEMSMELESMISFDSVKISVGGGSWRTVEDGETSDDEARPGEDFAVKVRIGNDFNPNDKDEIELKDIEVTAVFYDAGEDGDDISGKIDSFQLDAGEKSSYLEMEFDDDFIDWGADAGNLLMEIHVEGEDDNGAIHSADMSFFVKLERSSNAEFVITDFEMTEPASCGGPVMIEIDGRSVGEDPDDKVVLEVESVDLGIDLKIEVAMGAYDDQDCDALDEDDECNHFKYSKQVYLPEGLDPGDYVVMAKLFRDGGDDQTDEKSITVNVACFDELDADADEGQKDSSDESEQSEEEIIEVLLPDNEDGPGDDYIAPVIVPSKKNEASFRDSDMYLAVVSVLSVLFLMSTIILMVYTFTRPKTPLRLEPKG